MARLVRDLLTLSRFDYGEMDWRVALVNFNPSLSKVCGAMRLEAERRGHELTFTAQDALPDTYGDKERLEQVFFNIISNALYYTPDGGKVTVGTRREGDTAVITVEDNGIGIPAEDLPRVFERFYRVDKARSRSLGGTGLGLAIAREIVQKHRGSISVSSESPGGTTVTVRLPLQAEEVSC